MLILRFIFFFSIVFIASFSAYVILMYPFYYFYPNVITVEVLLGGAIGCGIAVGVVNGVVITVKLK